MFACTCTCIFSRTQPIERTQRTQRTRRTQRTQRTRRTRRTRPHPTHPAAPGAPGTPGATWTWSHGFKSLQKINPTIQKEIENLKKNNRKQIQKLKAQFTRRSTNKKQTNPKRSFFPKSAKQLDDGWPESVEEQSLLLLVWRHYITRQYIKDVF